MDWGLNRIDSLKLESFIEATGSGKHLYEKYGFQAVKEVNVRIGRPDAGEEWHRLKDRLLPIGYTAMWRPVNGIWKEGEPQQTWRNRLNSVPEQQGDIDEIESLTSF